MGLSSRKFAYVIVILFANPFMNVQATSAIYVFSWTVHDENISIPFSSYSDIYVYYDPIESKGILTNHILTSGGFDFRYSFFYGDIGDVPFDTVEIPSTSFYQYIDSVYLSQPGSIILMGHTNIAENSGLTEIQLAQEQFSFTFNSIPYPDFFPVGTSLLDIGSNDATNQLLLIGSDESGPLSILYDYNTRQWIEVESDVLSHLGRSGDMAVSSERKEAIYA